MEEKDLRALLRATSTRKRWRCLDETTLAAFADGRLEGKARAKVEHHLSCCPECRTQLNDVVTLASEEAPPEVPPGLMAKARNLRLRRPRTMFTRTWQPIAVASALAVVLLVATVELRKPATLAPPIRTVIPQMQEAASGSKPNSHEGTLAVDTSRSAIASSAVPVLLSPQESATLPIKQTEFRWTGVPGTVFYEVEVLTVDGNIAWRGRTQNTQLAIPQRIGLKQGQYFVWVRAHLADGKTVKSPAARFQVSADR